MNYGQARKLLSENVKFEKAVTNTGKELDMTSKDDGLSMQKCDVYIKVLKQDCPAQMKNNNSLDMQAFRLNQCKTGFRCKLLFDIRNDDQNDNDESWVYEYLSKYSQLIENKPQYYMLKIAFYNINKIDLYDKCNEIIERLSEPCTDCLEKKWKDMGIEKFKLLRNVTQNDKGR